MILLRRSSLWDCCRAQMYAFLSSAVTLLFVIVILCHSVFAYNGTPNQTLISCRHWTFLKFNYHVFWNFFSLHVCICEECTLSVIKWTLTSFNIPFKNNGYGGQHQPVHITGLQFTDQNSTFITDRKWKNVTTTHLFFLQEKDFQP